MRVQITNLLLVEGQLLVQCPGCGKSVVTLKSKDNYEPVGTAIAVQKCPDCQVTSEDTRIEWLDDEGNSLGVIE